MPGVDINALYIPYIPGFTTTVTNTGNVPVYWRSATLGSGPAGGQDNALYVAGAALTLTQSIYVIGAAATPGAQINISQAPTPQTQYIGSTIITSYDASQILQKLLVQQLITNELLAAGLPVTNANLDQPQNTSVL